MKTIKGIAAVALLCAGCAVSYYAGRHVEYQQHVKDYEAACILSDICRMQLDYSESSEFEERYFDTIDNLDCYPLHITKEEIHHNYSWCY